MKFCKVAYLIINIPAKIWERFVLTPIKKRMLKSCGKNVALGKNTEITWENCSIGNNVSIGRDAMFLCKNAPVCIGK